MMLTKDGITVEVTHPAEIGRYKRLGYVEEKPAEKAEKAEKADKPKAEKADKKGGE